MDTDRLIIVAYDIRDPHRWRRVFRTMQGYGEWLQLSVFQCRLSSRQRMELVEKLTGIIRQGQDHVVLIDVGPAHRAQVSIESLGRTVATIERRGTVV